MANILVVCDTKKRAKELFTAWYETLGEYNIRFRTLLDICCIDIIGGNTFRFISDHEAEDKVRGWHGEVMSDTEFERHLKEIREEGGAG